MTEQSNGYQVVTYVDRFDNGQAWAQPVRRVSCHDEAGAMFEAVRSLMVASTQRGLYWSEWRPAGPVGWPNSPVESGVPDQAFLRANGEIVLDLVALRRPTRARGATPATAHSTTRGEHSSPARPTTPEVEVVRLGERGVEETRRSPREDVGWGLPELMREDMLRSGCCVGEVARALGDGFDMRPRAAWRHALGWSQPRLALEYNGRHPGAGLTVRQVNDRERWPLTGAGHRRPSPEYLVRLAATHGHGCAAADLVDNHDLERLGAIDWDTVIRAVNAAERRRGTRAPRGAAGRPSGASSRHTT